jgi:hypothetical protein
MRSRIGAILLVSAAACWAQQTAPDPRSLFKIEFPSASPVTLVSADMGDSATTTRGSAMVIDLRASLVLRNSGAMRIRGVTLLVTAQEVAAGGKASVSVPSLNVASGETFPVRLDIRLLRPVGPGGPLVVVSLDGVLFDDLSFFGPNRLNSRRTMTVWETEARRDRRHFKNVLARLGGEGLRESLVESLARQAAIPRVNVQVTRGGRATNVDAAKRLQFAFLNIPDSPIDPIGGVANISGNEARTPSLEVRNRSKRPVRYFELGWIVRDSGGREFMAGSVPASDPEMNLAPGQKSSVVQDSLLRFTGVQGQQLSIAGMTGFVSQVEFMDGSVWVPSREAFSDTQFSRTVAPSAEEQRLTDLYRRRGLDAVVAELRRFE